MSFGSNLEKIRKEKKISQAKLGNALGITQQMISSYEKDISSPNIDSLIKLADYFQVSIDSLVGHIAVTEDPESLRSRVIRMFDTFTHEDKERCLLILNTLLLDREESYDKKKKRTLSIS
ncbi:MAG: helix-turn-helix transcriptional regulator [Anaerocolumna sp.]|jgi:transcriptional regulator with XRE-family HTH domain|nr:helix-turn-helix transcriptional regulator [Anaerocolumna sp.]